MSLFTRRDAVRTLAAGAALRLGRAAEAPPNILFMMSDDHASHAISAYGSKINRTPNIDRIAQQGVRFDNCFCTNSICTPSRAVILTGQYSHLNGVKTLRDPLEPSRLNVAKMLQNVGYQTALVGKWHLHKDPAGFDHWNILPGQGLYHNPEFIENGTRSKRDGYCTDLIGDYSLDWLKRRDKNKPFFLMCHHKAPHRPWQPNEKYQKEFAGKQIPEPDNLYDHYENRSKSAANATLKVGESMTQTDVKRPIPPDLKGDALRKWAYQYYMRDYLACVQSVDDNVGRVLDYLDADGLAQNTIVIYTSDQGFFLGDHGWFDKRFMYEESLRMPFLLRYPKVVKPGTANRDIVLNLDFAGTFLDFAGGRATPDMQGRSFKRILEGRTPGDWRQSMYYRYWMHLADHGVPAHYGVRTKQWKLIHYYGKALGSTGAIDRDTGDEWELFDLIRDPREMKSVYDDPKNAKVVADLKKELARLRKLYKDEDSV
jgi:arylsulfatase A-like enzyme